MRNWIAAAMIAAVGLYVSAGAPVEAASLMLAPTQTPIKYLVVIDDENVGFDHYFATYPVAVNPPFEPRFKALPNTPSPNGIAA